MLRTRLQPAADGAGQDVPPRLYRADMTDHPDRFEPAAELDGDACVRRSRAAVGRLLTAADATPSSEMTSADWDAVRRRARAADQRALGVK